MRAPSGLESNDHPLICSQMLEVEGWDNPALGSVSSPHAGVALIGPAPCEGRPPICAGERCLSSLPVRISMLSLEFWITGKTGPPMRPAERLASGSILVCVCGRESCPWPCSCPEVRFMDNHPPPGSLPPPAPRTTCAVMHLDSIYYLVPVPQRGEPWEWWRQGHLPPQTMAGLPLFGRCGLLNSPTHLLSSSSSSPPPPLTLPMLCLPTNFLHFPFCPSPL